MISGLIEWVEAWSWRLYRVEPERVRREVDLRVVLLRRLLGATGAACLLYVVLEWAGIVSIRTFPFDAIEVFVTLGLCRWLLARGHALTGTLLLLVVISHPAGFAIGEYGIKGPAAGLLIPSILVCGLLVGGYFLSTWTVVCCLLLAAITYRTGTLAESETLPFLAFWWVLFGATGWLVHLFSVHLERRWQVEHRQAGALSRMLQVMTSEKPFEGLLDRVSALLRDEFSAESVSLCRYDPATARLALTAVARRGESSEDSASSILADDLPVWREVGTTLQVIRIIGPATDPRISGWPALYAPAAEQLLIVPVVVDGVPAGLLAVAHRNRLRDPQEETELAQILARELALVLQIERLARGQRQAAILEERNRMAGEIHDSLAQGFTGIVVQLNAAEEMLDREPDAAGRHIDSARALARRSLDEARRSVRALRPQVLDEHGLPAALARIAQELTVDCRTKVDVQVTGKTRVLPADLELNVLRVGQEALTNAVRHSHCDCIAVGLLYEPHGLRLEVRDNGCGALPGQSLSSAHGGAGVPGMEERARRLGGQLQIDGRPGVGTLVTLTVPIG